jgi:hypothetical protein
MNIIEVEAYLRKNKFIFDFNGKTHISSKFIRDIAAAKEARQVSESKAVAIIPQNNMTLNIPTKVESTRERFRRFIAEAEVPYRVKTENRSYTCNAPSDASEKVFNKILNSDTYNYQALVMSTRLYYNSNAYKQKISNYFVTGTWESEYNEFMKKFELGTLEHHIKQQLKPSTGERKMI